MTKPLLKSISGWGRRLGRSNHALGEIHPDWTLEGAAGTGKTAMLKTAAELAESSGRRFVVVAPTLRPAQEAGAALGTAASTRTFGSPSMRPA